MENIGHTELASNNNQLDYIVTSVYNSKGMSLKSGTHIVNTTQTDDNKAYYIGACP